MRKILLLTMLLCSLIFSAYAKEQDNQTLPLVAPAETISLAEMNERLNRGEGTDLYLKLADDQVAVYQNAGKDRSLRKQIILTAPNSDMLRLYTNDKNTFRQMSKMLRDYEDGNKNFNGYYVITDVDPAKEISDSITIYRFWFMKLEKEKHSRRTPIGIGIGIGGGHHHGPWIGIGL
ncbi:MAG: hypothetical protein IJX10_03000 [Phascolarctobacterium sp.]|nr:hypothetical protein [Phascolarctobacterium sp.]